MKKVLVLASLSLLALSFSCGGGSSATEEEKGQAGLAYGAISSYMDFSSVDPSSVSVSEEIPETSLECNTGEVVTSGTIVVGDESATIDLTTDFQDCSATDDVCNTGEEVVMNGTLTTSAYAALEGESSASVTMDIDGTIDITGVFTASCTIDLNFDGTFTEAPNQEDIQFNGTVCGVNFEDIWNIEESEIEALCAAVLAGGETASL